MKINTAFRGLALAALIFVGCGTGIAHAATPITGCGTISTPGVYQLQNNITISDANCIVIATSSVSFDGAGHTITGNQNLNTQALRATNVSNITISNLNVVTFGHGFEIDTDTNVLLNHVSVDDSFLGINLLHTSSTTIASSTISNTQINGAGSPLSARGVELNTAASTTIRNSTFINNLIVSIAAHNNSHGLNILNNTFTGGDQTAISLYDMDTALVQGNTISNETYAGIETANTLSGITINNNTLTGNMIGLDIEDSTGAGIYSNNTISNSSNIAIVLYSPNNLVTGNTLSNNEFGIDVEYANDNILTSNTVHGLTSYGDYDLNISNVGSTTVSNNTFGITNNGVIAGTSNGLTFSNNTISSTTQDGSFFVSNTNLVVSGNTFYNIGGHALESVNQDGTDPLNPISIIDNIFASAITPISMVDSSGVLVLHNTIRSDSWIADNTGTNMFNDATSGNTYYLANGTPSWTLYDITDSDNNNYADHGADLPFDQATLGSTLWYGQGLDAHPYTLVAYVAPGSTSTPPVIEPEESSHSRSGGSVQSQVQNLNDQGKTADADALKAQFSSLFPAGPANDAASSGNICTPYLTSYIRLGAANDPAQVTKLQTFLNTHEGEALAVDGMYKQADAEAVKRFQQKYASEVLGVWGLSAPTGYVYRTTLLKINSMNCGSAIQCPYFTEYNSSTENANTAEVGKTKELLKELGFYTGAVDTSFDAALTSSLKSFQETFSATMLKPWGLAAGSGYKYKTTDKFLNMLVGCKTPAVDLDGKGTFDY